MYTPNSQALSFLASADMAKRRREIPPPMAGWHASGAGRLKRKLSAIFYADVADYSRLTGEDEAGTHRTLSTYLDAIASSIARYGGTVMHFAGDAVLADFGSVVGAVSCAVDIQRALKAQNEGVPDDRKLQFRIGINVGDVIVDRNEIYGDDVNVAARLQGLAAPGGICMSGAVHDTIATKLPLAYAFMGNQWVKNIVRPIRAFQVRLVPDAASTPGRLNTTWRPWRMTALAAVLTLLVASGFGAAWHLPSAAGLTEAVTYITPLAYRPSL